MSHSQVPVSLRKAARRLRRNLTDAERLLWAQLRGHRLTDLHFRRQTPIGRYIVDFVAHEPKVVIELDGSQHNRDENLKRDAERDAWLQSQDYVVLRFWNHEIFTSLDSIKETIYAQCIERLPMAHPLKLPPSQPSPTRGEG